MSLPTQHIPHHRNSAEFLREVRALRNGGYSAHQIAEKVNCCDTWVVSMFYLLNHGSARLIAEVEHGRFPHTIAIQIARAKDPEIQKILAEGYKDGRVKTAQLIAILQRFDEYQRETSNRSQRSDAELLSRHFSNETDKRERLVLKAKLAKSRLVFIIGALKQLFSEKRFVALLDAEGIHTMPGWLAERIK